MRHQAEGLARREHAIGSECVSRGTAQHTTITATATAGDGIQVAVAVRRAQLELCVNRK